MSDIRVFVVVHSNHAQLENVLPFLQRFGGVCFLPDFNTFGHVLKRDYFDQLDNVQCVDYTLENLVQAVVNAAGQRIVFVLTASSNYRYGEFQKQLFEQLQSLMPDRIADVFAAGHCMYGCTSCGHHEHRVPYKFSRFVNGTLEYNTQDVLETHWPRWSSEQSSSSSGKVFRVLIAPSVGQYSFLMRPGFMHSLLAWKEHPNVEIVVKLHGFCFPTNEDIQLHDDRVHPFLALSSVEQQNVAILNANFECTGIQEHNILPFLDACDAVITDVDSSVAFEALYFHPIVVMAFEDVTAATLESDYLDRLQTFATPGGLDSLLQGLVDEEIEPRDSRDFFASVYGEVSGNELQQIVESRGWMRELANPVQMDVDQVMAEVNKAFGYEMMVHECMAIGTPILDVNVRMSEFVQLYGQALTNIGMPRALWHVFRNKLAGTVFDAGDSFQFVVDEEGQMKVAVSASGGLKAEQDVWLIDHAVTFALAELPMMVAQVPQIAERMESLVGIEYEPADTFDESPQTEFESSAEEPSRAPHLGDLCEAAGISLEGLDQVQLADTDTLKVWVADEAMSGVFAHLSMLESLDLDDLPVQNLRQANLGLLCPNLEALSLWSCPVHSLDDVCEALRELPSLKALWLNDTPLYAHWYGQSDTACGRGFGFPSPSSSEYTQRILEAAPQLQILDRFLCPGYGEWAMMQVLDGTPSNSMVDLTNRGIQNINDAFVACVAARHPVGLDLRGNHRLQLDDGNLTRLTQLLQPRAYLLRTLAMDCDVTPLVKALPAFRGFANGVHMLQPDLNEEVCRRYATLVDNMWRRVDNFRVLDASAFDGTGLREGSLRFYLLDEFGSAIGHSKDANVRVATVLQVETNMAYGVMWTTRDLDELDVVLRDHAFGYRDEVPPMQQAALEVLWGHATEDEVQSMHGLLQTHRQNLAQITESAHGSTAPSKAKSTSTHTSDEGDRSGSSSGGGGGGRKVRVYTDLDLVSNNLNVDAERYEFVLRWQDAEWIFCTQEFSAFRRLRDNQLVNQFEGETCLTFKNKLVATVESGLGQPAWMPVSYDLTKDLALFVADFQQRQVAGQDNHWIVKPWNAARGIEITVVNTCDAVLKLSSTGPKIVSKYVERPLLFRKAKFDLRYITMVVPKEDGDIDVVNYRMFWIRCANHAFSLDTLDDYEKHFTVMNYTPGAHMTQILFTDFIAELEEENGHAFDWWADIQPRINSAFRECFVAATRAPQGIDVSSGVNTQCRGIYGMDVMLDEDLQPILLEVNFSPDCIRACNYDGHFYENVFQVLFTSDWKKNEDVMASVQLCDAL